MRTLLAVLVTANAVTAAPKKIVLKEVGMGDAVVCAEYTSASAARQPNRSCVDAALVREWILRNARPDACE